MKMPHKISIVTPSLNQADFIERTIRSVISQETVGDLEYLVMDGGSTDGTLDILEKYRSFIHLVSEPDLGMSDALNKGFSAASGDILGWLNSDDQYTPGALGKVISYFDQNPGCQWLYGQCVMVDETDREVRRWITAYKNRKMKEYSYRRLLVENYISQPAVFFRKTALEQTGLLDTGLKTAMDYDLWLRMARLGPPGVINETLACFRVHNASISARHYRLQFEEQYRIHCRYDRSPWLLFRHRLMNSLIVTTYSWLHAINRVTSKGDKSKSKDFQ